MKEIRLGVLGADRRGTISLLAHQPEKNVRVVAACSLTPEKLGLYRDQCGPDVFITADYREVMARADVDAVMVCTPDYLHAEHAIAALSAGKDVFLEKPMAITIEDCDAIIATARKENRKLYVGHNMRFFPVMQKMKSLVDEGRIGEVQAIWCRHFVSYGGDAYFKDWHSERRYTTGLLLQKGAHDIDIIHWLGGGHTSRVVGMGKLSVYNQVTSRRHPEEVSSVDFDGANWPPLSQTGLSPVINVEDLSMMLMELDNGVQASYQQCHYTPDDCRNYTVIGTEGRIENYGDASTPEKWATVHLWNQRNGYNEQGHEVFRIAPIEGEHGGADPLMIEDFLSFLRNGRAQGAASWDARMSVAAGVLATESLREGNTPKDVPLAFVAEPEEELVGC